MLQATQSCLREENRYWHFDTIIWSCRLKNVLILSNFSFLWPCIVNISWRERTNKMQLIRCLLSNFLFQHVSGIIMPIIRIIWPCPAAIGVMPGCVGCGWLWSCGAVSWAVCAQYTQLTTQPHKTTAYTPRQNTTCGRARSYYPNDGHNDARNMLK